MEPRIIKNTISKSELKKMAQDGFGDFVKVVVDVRQEIMAVNAELHADLEVFLNEREKSKREDVWGINLYPEKSGDEFIEFNSMVNVKPALGNRSRDVLNPAVREKVKTIVAKLVTE